MGSETRTPKYGDEVFVKDGRGTYVNGIVNEVRDDGLLVGVAAGAHKSGAQLLLVTEWHWPEEMPAVRARMN